MLSVQDLKFSYIKGKPVLNDVTFHLQPKEKVCILGESGSGKSTLLKAIHAEIQPDSGKISFDHQEIKGPDYQLIAGHEYIKYVPQDFQLDQYIPVREIVGKYLSNIDRKYKHKRVQEVLKALSITDLADSKSHELSGGQKQRVAIARALAMPPKLLLLDEPFSQLDSSLHLSIREQLIQFLEENNIAVLFTSHRADDALGFSDQIILMKNGYNIQQGRPQQVYENPANRYVASLFGDVNFINREQTHTLNLSRNYFKNEVAIYPEEIEMNENGALEGIVLHNRYQGSRYLISIQYGNMVLKAYSPTRLKVNTPIKFDVVDYRWIG